ncbi:MAG: carbamoyl-phosphate synthase small subunit [Nitrospirae bacterium]|nr:MAG: carbamoyl-phosphate synthase small subunit [Nitrospirota bacterium]
MSEKAYLALADGTVFEGRALGFHGETSGEVVFHTAMTGYQEILTDPSYKGQMIVMTCSHIGNYGVAPEDWESRRIWAEGLIVNEASRVCSNWRAYQTLHEYLVAQRIVAIEGIDTRFLTRHLRDHGTQAGVISHEDGDHTRLVQKAQAVPDIQGRDLVSEVTCGAPYTWTEGTGSWLPARGSYQRAPLRRTEPPYRVVVYDLGVKYNILRRLVDEGCIVTVVPAFTSADVVRSMNPDGVVFSNGPGDPGAVSSVIPHIRQLIGWRPILGICLGHQLLGRSLGLPTYKLKFGHHGANHPVMDLRSKRVEITSQNHNFAVGWPSSSETNQVTQIETSWGPFQITHVSLNDACQEGMRGREVPVISVQYHPEASPGPHDSGYVFRQFMEMMEAFYA